MAGGSTNRHVILGGSGSGKTTLAHLLARAYLEAGKANRVVVLSKDPPDASELRSLCDEAVELHDELAELGVDWRPAIEAAGSLYVQVTALEEKRAETMHQLGLALIELGGALVIVDEAHNIITGNAPAGLLQPYTRGRKAGINIITISQSGKQRGRHGLHRTVLDESTGLVAFHQGNPKARDQIAEFAPEAAPHLASLRTPRDGPPEYVVADLITGRTLLAGRDGERDLTPGGGEGARAM